MPETENKILNHIYVVELREYVAYRSVSRKWRSHLDRTNLVLFNYSTRATKDERFAAVVYKITQLSSLFIFHKKKQRQQRQQ